MKSGSQCVAFSTLEERGILRWKSYLASLLRPGEGMSRGRYVGDTKAGRQHRAVRSRRMLTTRLFKVFHVAMHSLLAVTVAVSYVVVVGSPPKK